MNQSFSLSLIAFVFVTAVFARRHSVRSLWAKNIATLDKNIRLEHFFLVNTVLSLTFLIVGSQLFFEKAFRYAIPGNDTANSRYSIVLIVCALISIFLLASYLIERDSRKNFYSAASGE